VRHDAPSKPHSAVYPGSDVDIIVLLVSASFVASDYAYDIELTQAVERHKAGDARVVPVMSDPSTIPEHRSPR
jgi:hypothetical protein